MQQKGASPASYQRDDEELTMKNTVIPVQAGIQKELHAIERVSTTSVRLPRFCAQAWHKPPRKTLAWAFNLMKNKPFRHLAYMMLCSFTE
jgi:hypothetical protein